MMFGALRRCGGDDVGLRQHLGLGHDDSPLAHGVVGLALPPRDLGRRGDGWTSATVGSFGFVSVSVLGERLAQHPRDRPLELVREVLAQSASARGSGR